MKDITSRLEEAKRIFAEALDRAKRDVQAAKEELTRPLTGEEIEEREEGL